MEDKELGFLLGAAAVHVDHDRLFEAMLLDEFVQAASAAGNEQGGE